MNLDRWKHLRDAKTPPDCMDWRHVLMINAVLRLEPPESIVEIGCARGFSTSAILEAVEKSGSIKTVDLVDPAPTLELANACLAIRPDHVSARFKVHPIPSQKYEGHPECWLIDGDHNGGALVDYFNARLAKAKIITVHDSNSANVIGNHRGSLDIGERLKAEATWFFEDKAKRAGEFTERGLVIGFFFDPKPETKAELAFIAA